ncbi:hypothetical protein ABLN97_04995 [Mycobacterium tuberculosis]
MRCGGFGTGDLGATHAVGMAQLGHEVVGVDIDPGKVAKLARGDIPLRTRPCLRKLLTDNLAAGRLRFTTDYDMAADFADVHFLGVGTPQKIGEWRRPAACHAVIDALVPRLVRASILVGKSTVPVGTAAELGHRAGALAPRGVDVEIAWNRNSCARLPRCVPSTPTVSSLGYKMIRRAPR